jgi:DNA-binding MarR family transcriptional regulator
MSDETTTQRTEALLMALLAQAHHEATRSGVDPGEDAHLFKLLSRRGMKGSEIAEIFSVSEATVSRRLKE